MSMNPRKDNVSKFNVQIVVISILPERGMRYVTRGMLTIDTTDTEK